VTDDRGTSRRKKSWRRNEGNLRAAAAYIDEDAKIGDDGQGMVGKRANGKKPMSIAGRKLGEFPMLLEQWHPAKNGNRDPRVLNADTCERVWWKCPMGPDHEWEERIKRRALGGLGCPFCRLRRLSITNRLDIVAPFLLPDWNSEKNGDLTPDKITYGSSKHVWWICSKGSDHVWQDSPRNRVERDTGCPFCSNKRISVTNSLATCKPELAKQWHPTKNGDLTPAGVVPGSGNQVWWQCPKFAEHVWAAPVIERTLGCGCPYCSSHRVSRTNSLANVLPDVARQWHPTKNGDLTPADVTSRSHRRVWWQCAKFAEHAWDTPVYNLAAGQGCPFCASSPQRVCSTNSLASRMPELVDEWHPTKNGALRPIDVTSRARAEVWWKCPKGPDHEWQARIYSRSGKGKGCPFCSGRRASLTTSLAAVCPRVAAQWHPTKNGDLTPAQMTWASAKRAYWRCAMGHTWLAIIYSRTIGGNGCPHCRRRKHKVVTKSKPRETVNMLAYEGPQATTAPARRAKKR
jgi:hypothetical protein